MRIAKHPTLDIFAREDGAVLLPSCVRHPVPDWTFGRKNNKGLMQLVFGYALFECTKCKKKYKASTITGEFKEF